MGLQIVIKKPGRYGRSRPEQEANLRKDGFRGMTDENLDRAKFIEKRTGWKGFIPQAHIKNLSDKLE